MRHAMTASRTTPTLWVLVIMTGPSRKPESSSQVVPVISPFPLRVNQPPKTGSRESLPRGRTAVTPVRTGPSPTLSLPLPEMRVVCPTSTPLTSVMALFGPGVPSKGTPRSRARGLVWEKARGPAQRRAQRSTRFRIMTVVRLDSGGSIKHGKGGLEFCWSGILAVGRRHGELEASGDCGIGGSGNFVGAERETSGGGSGGRSGIGGAGVGVSGTTGEDSRGTAVVCAAGDEVSGLGDEDRTQDRGDGGTAGG